MTSAEATAKYKDLSSLPFELQIEIFSLLPPLCLFTLRRVRKSWNFLLSNPELLNAINNKLPFLSSAHDLESRLKRRQRILHNDPVWVKRMDEVFPWSISLAGDTHGDSQSAAGSLGAWNQRRFLDGYLVTLSLRSALDVVLKIGHVTSPAKVVEVNVLEHFREKYPQVYDDSTRVYNHFMLFNPGARGVPAALRPFHLLVQHDKVLVGLKTLTPLVPKNLKNAEAKPRRLCDMFFLIFNLSGGTLYTHIHVPAPESAYIYNDYLLVSRLSSAHLLTVNVTSSWGEYCEKHTAHCWCYALRLNVYSIGTSPGVSVFQELAITPAKTHGHDEHDAREMAGIVHDRIAFTDDGTVLLPMSVCGHDAPGLELEASCVVPVHNERHGLERLIWTMGSLPGSALTKIPDDNIVRCMIRSPEGGLSGENLRLALPTDWATVYPYSADDHRDSRPGVALPPGIGRLPIKPSHGDNRLHFHRQKLCQIIPSEDSIGPTSSAILTERAQLVPKSDYEQHEQQFELVTHPDSHVNVYQGIIISTLRTLGPIRDGACFNHVLAIPKWDGLTTNLGVPLNWVEDGSLQDVTSPTSIAWGYLAINGFPVERRSRRNRKMFGDNPKEPDPPGGLRLFPYEGPFQPWPYTGNGLPDSLTSNTPLDERRVIRWIWGDDGLMCWEVMNNVQTPTSELWLVCYDEHWDIVD